MIYHSMVGSHFSDLFFARPRSRRRRFLSQPQRQGRMRPRRRRPPPSGGGGGGRDITSSMRSPRGSTVGRSEFQLSLDLG